MRATVPRHSWRTTGEVTTGPLGGVAIWSRCRWCGQIDSQERRRRLDSCSGQPRPEPVRPAGWWRRTATARGVALPPEPLPIVASPGPSGVARLDDRGRPLAADRSA